MFCDDPQEPYNGGDPFKLTFRDSSGTVVTVLADNYFGYCKKEVKISFSANLSGLGEEEHAGGTIVFPSYDLARSSSLWKFSATPQTFADTLKTLGVPSKEAPDGHSPIPCFPPLSTFRKVPYSASASRQFILRKAQANPKSSACLPIMHTLCPRDTRWK